MSDFDFRKTKSIFNSYPNVGMMDILKAGKGAVQEIERLQGEVRRLHEIQLLANESNVIKELQSQLAAVERERDEWKGKFDYWYKEAGSLSSNVDFQVKEKRKLEAENADLKQGFENMQKLHIDEKAEIAKLQERVSNIGLENLR